jgi:membrane protease YdiL (CAAX protease family)
MMTVKAFITKHPVSTYFALTFAISWGGVLLAIGGPGGIPATTEQNERLFPIVFLAMLVGPSVAGILLTIAGHGSGAVGEFLSGLLMWRVGVQWYAVALLTAPLLMTASLFALSLTSPIFLPGIFTSDHKATLLLFGIVVGLGAGFFEELGWTGFAVPRLMRRHGVFTSGLIVGVLWGAWHYLVNVWASDISSGALSLSFFLPAILFILLVGVLPAYRMLMVWVYDRTRSLLVAMLMHVSLTASMLILGPLAISGVPLLTYNLVLAAALWIVVATVAVANGGQLSRPALRSRAA